MKDHFLIGSITKTVFATAVLEQVAAGRLKLTDTVRQLDPALARRYPIAAKKTVAQLLGMTSRIPDYADPAVGKMFADPQQTFTRDQAIALGIAEGKAIPAPGGYSTTNYLLLGKIMKTADGQEPRAARERGAAPGRHDVVETDDGQRAPALASRAWLHRRGLRLPGRTGESEPVRHE